MASRSRIPENTSRLGLRAFRFLPPGHNPVISVASILSFSIQRPLFSRIPRRLAVLAVLFCSSLTAGSLLAQTPTLILEDATEVYAPGRYLDVLEDPDGEFTIEDIAAGRHAGQFARNESDTFNAQYTDSYFWLRLKLRNETDASYVLEIQNPVID
jgi:hypothetical protein